MTSAKQTLVSASFIMILAITTACGGPILMIPSGELEGFDPTRFIYRLDPR